jgi:general secretion pathway protein K
MSSSNGCNRSGASARSSSIEESAGEREGERGYALIAVVAIVGILSVIALALTERARVGAAATSAFLEETRDLYAVQAAIASAERALAGKPDLGKDGQLRLELSWDERHLDILVTDQTKKIDVNRASFQQLAEGFAALGFSTEEASALAARTVDWRDPDDRPQPHGAEAADYQAAGLLSTPRNDRFVSLDEVGTLIGMPPDGSAKLRQQFVVTRGVVPIARPVATALNIAGLDRQASKTTPSDGLTRSADVTPGARDFDVEVRMRRDGENVKRMYFSVLSD